LSVTVNQLSSHLSFDTLYVLVGDGSYLIRVPGYESWWDVPVARVSEAESVKRAARSLRRGGQTSALFPLNRTR